MKTLARLLLMLALVGAIGAPPLTAQSPSPETPRDVPDIAIREIQRRGNLVQRLGGGHQSDTLTAFAEAMRPPEDDSHKWFISVVTARNCKFCDSLKRDFANSEHLKPFVDVEDHTQSWSHYNVYASEDATQAWRFKDVKITGYPTILIQPPRSGRFGDPKTVVMQKTGYEGDPKKLAEAIRSGISTYLRTQVRQREAIGGTRGMRSEEVTGGIGQTVTGYEPPFTSPQKNDPTHYPPAPVNFPFDLPSGPTLPTPPQFNINPLTLLLSLLGGMVTSGGMTNLLLLVIAGLAVVRTFRKATGQKLLLDDATFQAFIDGLKSVVTPTAPKKPSG